MGYPRPLLFGRLARILTGVALWVASAFVPDSDAAWLARLAFAAGGLVFVLAGWIANPGCEITAPVNLFRRPQNRLSCWCPLFTPIDQIERALRGRSSKG